MIDAEFFADFCGPQRIVKTFGARLPLDCQSVAKVTGAAILIRPRAYQFVHRLLNRPPANSPISLYVRNDTVAVNVVAGVAGFEPTYGGIKTSHGAQQNHQFIDSIRLEEPLAYPRIPIAATRPVPAESGSDLRLMPGLRIIEAVIAVRHAVMAALIFYIQRTCCRDR
ncbi:MAG: hypothetical protein WDO56_32720 [Gammaproteobacteria bacterium]